MKTKNIVIVGTSRGIGKELVINFAKNNNHRIFALSRNMEGLKELHSLKNVSIHHYDLTEKDLLASTQKLFKEIESIDILINNAGKLINKPFLELTKNDLQSCYDVNILGVFQTVQGIVPKMIKHGGHIVNISSMGGFQGSIKFSGLAAYSSSKAALVNFTEMFSEEFKESKIKMNCLCLGAVQTEMLHEAFPNYKAPVSASEMAEFIADFSLNASKYINGKIIPVSLSTP
jgi:3-oxoacyl-[acyl-carrier protein] reductase